jgi:hypothetical protein
MTLTNRGTIWQSVGEKGVTIMRLLALLTATIVVACASPPRPAYVPLGARGVGMPAEQVSVLADIRINELRIRHVSIADQSCVGGRRPAVELQGPIGPDSSEAMERLLRTIQPCVRRNGERVSPHVFLDSTGGLLSHGYKLGATLKEYNANTVVTGGQQCSSACAIAFLGGRFRTVEFSGQLLFHSPYLKRPSSSEQSSAPFCPKRVELTELEDYFVRLIGAEDGKFVFERTLAYCSTSNGWIVNADAAKLFGIANR